MLTEYENSTDITVLTSGFRSRKW